MQQLITIIFFDPFLNVLLLLDRLLGNNMGLAIIALTVLFKLVVLPLNLKMLRSQRRMQSLKPKLDKLKAEHGADRMALAQAQMDLYKAEGVSPTGGCLPLLLQLPFLFGVYAVFRFVVGLKNVEQLNSHLYWSWLHLQHLSDLNLQFGWTNLAQHDAWLILPLLAAGSQLVLSKMMMMPKQALPEADTPKEASLEDSFLAAQNQMVYLFPVMTFLITWQFPAGLGLYWTVGNLFSIIQQFYINQSQPIAEARAELAEIEEEAASSQITEAQQPRSSKRTSKKKKR